MLKLEDLKIGQKYRYAFFSEVTIVAFEEDTVVISDISGKSKEVYLSLFLKYGREI